MDRWQEMRERRVKYRSPARFEPGTLWFIFAVLITRTQGAPDVQYVILDANIS